MNHQYSDTVETRLIFFHFTVIGNPIVLDDVTNNQRTFCNTTLLWADEYADYCNTSKLLIKLCRTCGLIKTVIAHRTVK